MYVVHELASLHWLSMKYGSLQQPVQVQVVPEPVLDHVVDTIEEMQLGGHSLVAAQQPVDASGNEPSAHGAVDKWGGGGGGGVRIVHAPSKPPLSVTVGGKLHVPTVPPADSVAVPVTPSLTVIWPALLVKVRSIAPPVIVTTPSLVMPVAVAVPADMVTVPELLTSVRVTVPSNVMSPALVTPSKVTVPPLNWTVLPAVLVVS